MITVYVGTHGWTLETDLTLDGAAWDVSAGTVSLGFVDPDGNTTTKAATPGVGVATYIVESGLIDEVGAWYCLVTVDCGGLHLARAFPITVISVP